MNITRRIKFFGIGLGIGLVLTVAIFGSRGCSWLPNERVLSALQQAQIKVTKKSQCEIECQGYTSTDIFLMFETGDIDFKNSDVSKNQKIYRLVKDSMELTIGLQPVDSVAVILGAGYPGECQCNELDQIIDYPLYMPGDLIVNRIKDHKIKFDDQFSCDADCFNIDLNKLNEVLANGVFKMEQSLPFRTNPLYIVEFENDKGKLLFLVEEGATRVRFKTNFREVKS